MTGEADDRVLVSAIGPIRILTLNRPNKLNAADLPLQRQLLARLIDVAADEGVRVLILTGAGRAFCAGGDRALAEAAGEGRLPQAAEHARIQVATDRNLLGLSIPTIAAVRGAAVGYGAGLIALCDIVVMGDGAFLSDPHVRYGLAPTPAAQLAWPRLTSYIIAKELLMTGRQVQAPEALALGLCNRVCAAGEELSSALEMAQALVDLPAAGIAAAKRALNRPLLQEMDSVTQDNSGR